MSVNILQINTTDVYGGAEAVALNLHRRYRALGQQAALGVGARTTNEPGVYGLQNGAGDNLFWQLDDVLAARRFPGKRTLRRWLRAFAEPGRWRDQRAGLEDFRYPAAQHLLETAPFAPDVIHAHNLHRDYFDLRALPQLSHRRPFAITAHDTWLLSGHCAYALDCQRWQTGCGQCPDLTLYPPLQYDGTAANWQRKRDLYAHSRLYVAAPCHWMLRAVEHSMLMPGVRETRVIPNGVDTSVFRPADPQTQRRRLGLPADAFILLFVASSIRNNMWKDYATLRAAVARLAEHTPDLYFVALGDSAPDEQVGRATIHFVPYQKDPATVARYYQAADVYIHAARADTFPTTVLEALACGAPVVATAVGGIPEQVIDGETGFLTPPGDAEAMAARLMQLRDDPALRRTLAERAAHTARERFDLDRQAHDYLEWYAAGIDDFNCHPLRPHE